MRQIEKIDTMLRELRQMIAEQESKAIRREKTTVSLPELYRAENAMCELYNATLFVDCE